MSPATGPPVAEDAFFRGATLQICSSPDLEEALRRVLEFLGRFLPLDAILVLSHDPARAAAQVLAGAIGGEGDLDAPRQLESVDLQTRVRLRRQGTVVDAANPVRVRNRPGRDEVYRTAERYLAPRGLARFSLLAVRLDIAADYQGLLLLAAAGHDAYRDEHAVLAALLSGPVALAVSSARRHQEALRLARQLTEDSVSGAVDAEGLSADSVIGAEEGLRPAMELVRQVAPMHVPVLLQGETGTGKEVIAQCLHLASPRRHGPLVRVQCGAVPDTLFDSEVFGHERGAFTGAAQVRRGRFERADGGTIFFDEIGELPLESQVKLLRVLQDHTFERLGGSQTLRVDARVIAATNRDLPELVRQGGFRQDLFFRLNVFPITLPPLRARRQDIPALVHHFVARKAREMRLGPRPNLAPGAMEQLQAYDWPGNVRELQNVIERGLILSRGRDLDFAHLAAAQGHHPAGEATAGAAAADRLDQVIADHISAVLARTGGKVEGPGGAAAVLGVKASTLRARMRKLRVPYGRRAKADSALAGVAAAAGAGGPEPDLG